jgi:hypothetical protein
LFRRLIAEVKVLWSGLMAAHRPSLSKIVRRLHSRHMRLNPAAISLRFGPSRAVLAILERRPRLAAIGVILLYVVVGLVTWLAPPIPWGPIKPVADYFRDLQTVNLALFGAQATLLGLVYPLVIALVGMLFGQRSSSDRRLDVYFSETEAVAVGGLALGLVGAIALQSLLYGQLELKVVGTITVLNCLWFTANLWGLGFFVLRSLDFIRPARRQEMVKSYMANTAFRRQLRDLMTANQWAGAPGYGHLPKLTSEDAVMLPGFGSGTARVIRTFKGSRQLKDIRLGLLYAVLSGRQGDEPPIGYSVRPGGVYEKEAILVIGGQGPLLWSERLLLRLAFRFGPASRANTPPSSETLLTEAAGDLLGLVGSGRYDEFDARMDETVDLHALLYRLAQEPAEEGAFNYATESGFQDLTPMGRNWTRAYMPLLKRVGEPLDADGRFYERCAYFPSRLGNRIRDLPFDARKVLFDLPFALYHATLTGAVRRHLESLAAPPPAGGTFTIKGSGSEFYRRNLISFVAGWERFGWIQTSLKKEEQSDWAELVDILPGLKRHLRDTVVMTALSAQVGETQAIGWMADLLLKWRDKTKRRLDPGQAAFSLQRTIISLALAEKPWDEVAALSLSAWDHQPVTPIGVFDAAVENVWIDSLMVLVTSLMETFGLPEADGRVHNGAGAAAGAIFRNQAFDPGAGGHPHSPPLNATGVLASIVRIAGVGERFEDGYAAELSKLAETIKDLKGPNYVSARVYSWSGTAGFEDQTYAQLLLLAATMDAPSPRRGGMSLAPGLQALLLPDGDRAKRRIQEHLRAMREAAKLVDPDHGRGVIATLQNQDVSGKDLADRLAAAVAVLEQCEALIQTARDAEVLAAPIDAKRLATFVGEVAGLGFKSGTGTFPVTVFSTVEHVQRALAPRIITLTIDKGVLTDPPFGNVPDNLAEAWARELSPMIGGYALAAVVDGRRPTRRRPRDEGTYWTALKAATEDVRAAGQTPVIVRSNRHQPLWLGKWHYGSGAAARPADMRIARRNVDDDGYDFDLNDVAVYSSRGTGAATWVFGLETLSKVSFQRFANDEPLDPSFQPDPADPWKGTLKLAFGLEVEIAAGPVWRLDHPKLKP